MAYHYYEAPQFDVSMQFNAFTRDAKRLGTAAFLTETSMPGSDGADKFSIPGGIGDGADQHAQSWAGYQWKSFFREPAGPDPESQFGSWGSHKTGTTANWPGTEPAQSVKEASARTYAKSVAGEIRSMFFNVTSGDFELRYNCAKLCDAVTDIFAWPERYPGGPRVEVQADSGDVHVEVLGGGSQVQVRVPGASDELVVVRLSVDEHSEGLLV